MFGDFLTLLSSQWEVWFARLAQSLARVTAKNIHVAHLLLMVAFLLERAPIMVKIDLNPDEIAKTYLNFHRQRSAWSGKLNSDRGWSSFSLF